MSKDTPKDEEVSRLYREGASAEPPPALDAAIRAAARQALVGRSAQPRPWWQRWRMPVGVFATIVLTVTLTLLVERDQEREAGPPSVPAAARSQEAMEEKAMPPSASAATPRPSGAATSMAPKAAAGAPAAPAVAGVHAPVPASDLSIGAERATAATENGAFDQAAERAPAAAKMKRESASAAPSALAPEVWIEAIRRLRREGRSAEARRQLAEFSRAYPDYLLPADLRP